MSALRRMSAITRKELKQLSRDRLTFGMVVMIPLMSTGMVMGAILTKKSAKSQPSRSPMSKF